MAGDFGIVSRGGIEQSTLEYPFEVPFGLLCVRVLVRVCVCCPSVQILTDRSSAGQTLRIGDNLLSATHFIRQPVRQLIRCTDRMENPRVLGKVARRLQNRMTKK